MVVVFSESVLCYQFWELDLTHSHIKIQYLTKPVLYFVVTKGGKMKHFFQALFIILNESQFRLNLEKMVCYSCCFNISQGTLDYSIRLSQLLKQPVDHQVSWTKLFKSFSRQFCVKGYMYSGTSCDSEVLGQSVCLFRGNKTTGEEDPCDWVVSSSGDSSYSRSVADNNGGQICTPLCLSRISST